MSFRFKSANCVAVGTFNIYIIQPKWSKEVGLWSKGEKFELQMDLRQPGFRFRRVTDDPLRWSVRPERLTVETNEFGADCGTPVSNVLHHLQWTRLEAVGSNETYSCAVHDVSDLVERMLPLGVPSHGDYDDVQRSWRRGLRRNNSVTNVQLSVSPADGNATVVINIHTEVGQIENQEELTRRAQDSCRAFGKQLAEARELASELLSVDLQHEPVNA